MYDLYSGTCSKRKYCQIFLGHAKINFGALVIGLIAKVEDFHLRSIALGVTVGVLLCVGGYLFDGMEVDQ